MKYARQLYVASGAPEGGIYHFEVKETGETRFIKKYSLGKTMYMAIEDNRLYALRVTPHQNEGELTSFEIQPGGSLSGGKEFLPTKGKEACHLALDHGQAYCVNYDSASVIKMPDNRITHKGKGETARQEAPHPHYVGITPDQKYVFVVDLGLDKILVYDKDLKYISETAAPSGYGPRHVVFSEDGKTAYCANELISSVSAYSYEDGRFSLMETVSSLPEGYEGENYPSAIRIADDSSRLYTANRGHDSICCFDITNGRLKPQSFTDCGGCWPRDFILSGNLLICENERSDNVTLFKMDGSRLTKLNNELKVPVPLAALFCNR